MSRSLALGVCALALLASCVEPTLKPRKLSELQAPGFIDVGAGYAVAFNTNAAANNDADGLLVSLKAYPFGRWYAKPRSTSQQALAQASRVLVAKKIEESPAVEKASVEEAKRHVDMALGKLRDQTETNRSPVLEECQTCVARASASLRALAAEDKGWVADVLHDLEQANTSLAGSREDESENDLESAGRTLDAKREELAKAESEIANAVAMLAKAQNDLLNEEFYEVETSEGDEHDSPWSRIARRFSVFYGTSVSDFGGGGLESKVNAVGLAFDVAPQFSILVGYGFYRVDDGGGVDTDGGLVAAVSLNLNAFRWMFGSLSN